MTNGTLMSTYRAPRAGYRPKQYNRASAERRRAYFERSKSPRAIYKIAFWSRGNLRRAINRRAVRSARRYTRFRHGFNRFLRRLRKNVSYIAFSAIFPMSSICEIPNERAFNGIIAEFPVFPNKAVSATLPRFQHDWNIFTFSKKYFHFEKGVTIFPRFIKFRNSRLSPSKKGPLGQFFGVCRRYKFIGNATLSFVTKVTTSFRFEWGSFFTIFWPDEISILNKYFHLILLLLKQIEKWAEISFPESFIKTCHMFFSPSLINLNEKFWILSFSKLLEGKKIDISYDYGGINCEWLIYCTEYCSGFCHLMKLLICKFLQKPEIGKSRAGKLCCIFDCTSCGTRKSSANWLQGEFMRCSLRNHTYGTHRGVVRIR